MQFEVKENGINSREGVGENVYFRIKKQVKQQEDPKIEQEFLQKIYQQ